MLSCSILLAVLHEVYGSAIHSLVGLLCKYVGGGTFALFISGVPGGHGDVHRSII